MIKRKKFYSQNQSQRFSVTIMHENVIIMLVGMKWNGMLLDMYKVEMLTQKKSSVLGKR